MWVMKKLVTVFVLLATGSAFADEMPKGSKQFQALLDIVGSAEGGGMGGFATVCPAQLQIPGVQISCSVVFDQPLSVPAEFDRARVDQSIPLEPTSEGWTYYPYDRLFERRYTFPDGSTFRVGSDAGEGTTVNIAAYYEP